MTDYDQYDQYDQYSLFFNLFQSHQSFLVAVDNENNVVIYPDTKQVSVLFFII